MQAVYNPILGMEENELDSDSKFTHTNLPADGTHLSQKI